MILGARSEDRPGYRISMTGTTALDATTVDAGARGLILTRTQRDFADR